MFGPLLLPRRSLGVGLNALNSMLTHLAIPVKHIGGGWLIPRALFRRAGEPRSVTGCGSL
jgi:hypothetical protein